MTPEQIFRRAQGRRRYNNERQEAARERRDEVARLLDLYGPKRRGVRARIARELGVSRATVTRDVRVVEALRWALKHPARAIRMLYGLHR